MPNLQLIPGTLPGSPYCPTTYQQLYNDMFALGYAVLPAAYSGVWVSDTPPTDLVTYKVWVRTVAGKPVYPSLWTLDGSDGQFHAPNAIPASSNYRSLWVGVESDVWAFDGGDGTNPGVSVPTAYTGAMWEVDHSFDARMPIGPGTLSTGKNITPGYQSSPTEGEAEHTLVTAEMPSHTHATSPHNWPGNGILVGDAGGAFSVGAGAGVSFNGIVNTGGDGPHNNMPPYIGVYFIKRTARIQYDTAHLP